MPVCVVGPFGLLYAIFERVSSISASPMSTDYGPDLWPIVCLCIPVYDFHVNGTLPEYHPIFVR